MYLLNELSVSWRRQRMSLNGIQHTHCRYTHRRNETYYRRLFAIIRSSEGGHFEIKKLKTSEF